MFAPDDLLVALTNAHVDFVVIGGVAVGVHGFLRATQDLDIVPDGTPENLASASSRSRRTPSLRPRPFRLGSETRRSAFADWSTCEQ